MLRGLPPVIDQRARILILGLFPSTASLAAQQYYAHPQNLFWRIVGEVVGQSLHEMSYGARCEAVKGAGIAIWDVFASCSREGSLDSAIRDAVPNDFSVLQKSAVVERRCGDFPVLSRVCFNGQKAAKHIKEFDAAGVDVVVLPSTSPANAGMCFGEKLALWRNALCG